MQAKNLQDIKETVLIETKNGPVLINKEDFDEKTHVLFDENKPTKRGRKKK